MNLILLPGLDGTGELFGPFVSETPKHWSTTVVGYPRDQAMDYGEYVDLVRDQLPTEEDFLLLGESFSGPVAISLAARKPPSLRGVVLCNTFARRPWWQVFGALPWPHIFARPVPSLILKRMGAQKNNQTLRAQMRSATSSVAPQVLAHRLRQALRVDVTESLMAIEVPILYLRGTLDTTVRGWSLRHIRSKRPDVVLSELPVPHLLLQLLPKQAWAEVDSFSAEWCAA